MRVGIIVNSSNISITLTKDFIASHFLSQSPQILSVNNLILITKSSSRTLSRIQYIMCWDLSSINFLKFRSKHRIQRNSFNRIFKILRYQEQIILLTRQNCEVVDFTRSRVKNICELTNLMKMSRIEGYNGK